MISDDDSSSENVSDSDADNEGRDDTVKQEIDLTAKSA